MLRGCGIPVIDRLSLPPAFQYVTHHPRAGCTRQGAFVKKTILTGAIACAITPAFADDLATYDMGTLVVTATRTPTPVRELLNDITVITREEIERSGQTSLPELLRSQPGIEINTNGGAGTTSNVYIRGANPNHTLVLIDGMRINSATSGTTALEKIPLAQIDHIEILRGPGSALYGSEAIGGVIQIFTKTGDAKPGWHVGGGIGTHRLYDASLGGSIGSGATRLSVEAAHRSTHSFSAIGNAASYYYNPDADPYREASLSAKLSHRLNADHEFGATTFYNQGKGHFDGSAIYDSRDRRILSSYGVYSNDRVLADWSSQLRAGHSYDDLRSLSTTSWTKFRTDQDQLSWQNNFETRAGRFTLGTDHDWQHVTSTTVYTVNKRTVHSYFAGYQGRFGDHSLQLNGRNDDNSQFGNHTTGSAAYGYQIAKTWRASASIGTAFRAPTFNELYYPSFGNPNLQPETARNEEIALHYDQGAQHASLIHFDNRIRNLIAYASNTYLQVQDAHITGTTLSYAGRVGSIGTHASATWQDPRNTTNDKLLIRRAKRTVSAGADYAAGAWTFGGDAVASSMRFDDTANTVPMGGYTVLNLNAGYRYNKDLSFITRLNNALDKKYELARDYNTEGRSLYFGFDYHPK